MFGRTTTTSKTTHADTPQAAGEGTRPTSTTPRNSADRHSVVAADAAITGDLISSGDISVEGKVDGNIKCRCLTLSGAPEINGTAEAETVVVAGTFNGDIRAKTVVLTKNARMRGDIFKETLEIHPGAEFEGKAARMESTPAKPIVSGEGKVRAADEKHTAGSTLSTRSAA